MFRKIALAALTLSCFALAGCDEPAPTPAPEAAPAAAGADDSAAKKPAFRHGVSARDGYKPRTDLCSVPPCGDAAQDKPAPAEANDTSKKQ